MPRRSYGKGDRRRRKYEERQVQRELRQLAGELHQGWRERTEDLNTEDELSPADDDQAAEPTADD